MSNRLLPALMLSALTLSALTLTACAPAATTSLTNLLGPKTPDRAGPLIVGQTWAVSGILSGRTQVSKTLAVPQLIAQDNNNNDVQIKATLSTRDQVAAQQVPSSEYQYVAYVNSDQYKQVRFSWNVAGGLGRVDTYTCQAAPTGSLPLRGVLTLKRPESSMVQTGTCTATPTNPPPLAPAPEQPQTPAPPASP